MLGFCQGKGDWVFVAVLISGVFFFLSPSFFFSDSQGALFLSSFASPLLANLLLGWGEWKLS